MRILLISDEYPPYAFGGVATYVDEVTKYLATQRNLEVTVVSGRSYRPRIDFCNHQRIRIFRLPIPALPPRHYWFQLFNKSMMIEIARRADLIHVQSISASTIIRDLKKATKKPVIVTLHGSPLETLRATLKASPNGLTLYDLLTHVVGYPINAFLHKKELEDADCLVAVANHVLQETSDFFGRDIASRSVVIYPGIDIEKLVSERSRKPDPKISSVPSNAQHHIVFAGRLYLLKGITYLVQAFDIIINEFKQKDVILEIYGTGPLKAKILRYLKKKKLEKNVCLYGWKPRHQVISAIAQSDVVVLPSIYEACPLVLLEAMALGKPCVSFSFPWTREFIIHGKTGLLASQFDCIDLAQKITYLCSDLDSSRRIGANASISAMQHDISRVGPKLIELYENLASLGNFVDS